MPKSRIFNVAYNILCLLKLFAKMKFSRKFPNLQYSNILAFQAVPTYSDNFAAFQAVLSTLMTLMTFYSMPLR